MPLRAKITNPAFAGNAKMSMEASKPRNYTSISEGSNSRTTPSETAKASEPVQESESAEEDAPEDIDELDQTIKELPGDPKEDVLFNTLYGVRTIELNRPEKLHSLDGSMIRKIVPRLQAWAKSDMANVIVIKGSGPKAFCAGGDVAALAKDNMTGEEGQRRSADYFALEYKLDHLIATYKKPYVAFMDGITMGGGVGLSVHAPLRIATERTVFAMPETTIGLFPDVGASFFLPRMPGAVGTYLALTSERLTGANVFYAGIATHYIHSSTLPALERRLAELRFKDYDTLETRLGLIDSTIEEYCTGLPHDQSLLLGGELRNAIDRCFSKNSVRDIIVALQAEKGSMEAWAKKTLKSLHQRSPTSVYVTLRQMRLGANWSIAETFQREHQMAAKFMEKSDFTEGVDALLIRKDKKPAWNPASLEDIKYDSNIADRFFEVDNDALLRLLSEDDFKVYPWRQFGIPLEEDVARVWNETRNKKKTINYIVDQRHGKQGIKEVVTEIINRKVQRDAKGAESWS